VQGRELGWSFDLHPTTYIDRPRLATTSETLYRTIMASAVGVTIDAVQYTQKVYRLTTVNVHIFFP
jgi:hypothetical protein